ncbi:MAG TPA: MerR family transcriptional regulator [Gaiellaceae bacterium]
MRIGQVATRSGVTPRTIRYYEELGLLPTSDREQGKHRTYTESDIERLREVTRLRDLLGLSLDELRSVVVAEAVRADARRRFRESDSPDERRAALEDALPHLEMQIGLVRRRAAELKELEHDLVDRRRRALRALRQL